MLIKKGKTVKLRSELISKLDSMKSSKDSYSFAIERLIDIAECFDTPFPSGMELK